MKLIRRISLTAAVLMILAAGAGAAATTSNYAGEAMSIGVGARALGMGGTFAGIADDASTSYWNAAGMTQIQGVEVSSVKLTQFNLDTNYSYVNLVYNAKEYGAYGIGWLRQAIEGIKLTDDLGNIISDVAVNADNAVYLAAAYPFIPGFSAGISAKILIGNYPYVDAGSTLETGYFGFGFDMGLLINVSQFVKDVNLSIGVNVQDIYTTITWNSMTVGLTTTAKTEEKVGLNIKPGISYKLPVGQFEFVVASDLDTRYEQTLIHAGGEIWWNKMVAIRGGVKLWGDIDQGGGSMIQQEMDWSLGAGLRWYFLGVDFTYVHNELMDQQYLSIIGKF